MGRNKKRPSSNGAISKPTQSFSKLVADATKQAVDNVINQKIQQLGLQLAQNQARELSGVVTRLAAVEEIIMENMNITQDQLTEKVSDIEDKILGLETVSEVALGDTVRISVSVKPVEGDGEFGELSRVQVPNVGNSPFTLPQDLEEKLLTLKSGEITELTFGVDDAMVAKITIDRVSRKIVEESNESDSTEE